jgi:hypothetical protein
VQATEKAWLRKLERHAARKRPWELRNIRRIDHNFFHGWLVHFERAGSVYEDHFNDRGDRQSALWRAITWRDWVEARLPKRRKFQRRHVRNNTGVVGVLLVTQRSRRGTLLTYAVAHWTEASGRKRKRSFSVLKYGKREALARAKRIRLDVLAEMLRPEIEGEFRARPRGMRERSESEVRRSAWPRSSSKPRRSTRRAVHAIVPAALSSTS